jgi:hypothetical protein
MAEETKGERREKKHRRSRGMRVVGRSVRTILQTIKKRSERVKRRDP